MRAQDGGDECGTVTGYGSHSLSGYGVRVLEWVWQSSRVTERKMRAPET